MISQIEKYYSTLFDPDESVCFAWKPKDFSVTGMSNWEDQRSQWISTNPLLSDRDNDPESSVLPWAKATHPRRADCNVSVFRNILVEMDKVPLNQQWGVIRDCGMPFSTSVYSGNKSIHFVISLSDPCKDRAEYNELVRLVHMAVPAEIDPAVKNPSRLMRNADVMRTDNNKMQRLLEVRTRVSKKEVVSWAASLGIVPVKKKPIIFYHTTKLPAWVENMLATGVQSGERNTTAFKLACKMSGCSMRDDEIILRLMQCPGIRDLQRGEIERIVRSARMRNKN